jgi:hypothetical protein
VLSFHNEEGQMGTSETVFLVKEQIKTIPQAGKGQK